MKIAVIGANGQLGSDMVTAFTAAGDAVESLTHTDIEISDWESTSQFLDKLRPNVIVNTAAMHHVDKCEQEPAKAFAVNGIGSRNLARAANDIDALLIHISTDYVFDGSKKAPYEETDAPLPLNVYGNTKLSGEYFVRSIAKRHQVLRTSGIYGKEPCRGKGGLNFVETMLKIAREKGKVRVVGDEFVSPTFTPEIAEQAVALSRSSLNGLFHATAEGSCSWYEFAREIFTLTGTKVELEKAAPGEFPAKVLRPKYSVLENRALKSNGLNKFRPWQEGLKRYIEIRNQAPASEPVVSGAGIASRA
jgi:dTDP-4-dehydrorhamnose reductase